MKEHIEKLQKYIEEQGIDAYVVFTSDDHGSEYVVDHFKARAFLSGFTGSAGTLVVTKDDAYLWTDGRYFIQAEAQLKESGTKLMKMGEPIAPNLQNSLRIWRSLPWLRSILRRRRSILWNISKTFAPA